MLTRSDSIEAWVDYAERCLHGLAHDLRRVPFLPSTRRMHVRALELKRDAARWRATVPDVDARVRTLDEIEQLASEARRWRVPREGARHAEGSPAAAVVYPSSASLIAMPRPFTTCGGTTSAPRR